MYCVMFKCIKYDIYTCIVNNILEILYNRLYIRYTIKLIACNLRELATATERHIYSGAVDRF